MLLRRKLLRQFEIALPHRFVGGVERETEDIIRVRHRSPPEEAAEQEPRIELLLQFRDAGEQLAVPRFGAGLRELLRIGEQSVGQRTRVARGFGKLQLGEQERKDRVARELRAQLPGELVKHFPLGFPGDTLRQHFKEDDFARAFRCAKDHRVNLLQLCGLAAIGVPFDANGIPGVVEQVGFVRRGGTGEARRKRGVERLPVLRWREWVSLSFL